MIFKAKDLPLGAVLIALYFLFRLLGVEVVSALLLVTAFIFPVHYFLRRILHTNTPPTHVVKQTTDGTEKPAARTRLKADRALFATIAAIGGLGAAIGAVAGDAYTGAKAGIILSPAIFLHLRKRFPGRFGIPPLPAD